MYKRAHYEVCLTHVETARQLRVRIFSPDDIEPGEGFGPDFPFKFYEPDIKAAYFRSRDDVFSVESTIYREDTYEVDGVFDGRERTVEMRHRVHNLSSFLVGYIDKDEGPAEERYLIKSITRFEGGPSSGRTFNYPDLIPTDKLGREAQDCLWAKESPFYITSRPG